jgi:hypothetical protein
MPENLAQRPLPTPGTTEYRIIQEAILTALANDRVDERLPDAVAVLPSIHSWQNPDLVIGGNGEAALIFDQPLPDTIWWAEYDPELAQLIFVTITGQIMGLGVRIPPEIDRFLRYAKVIYLVQIDETGKMVAVDDRRLIVRDQARIWDRVGK